MTTANIMLQFPGPSAVLIRAEAFLGQLIMSLLDWTVDASRWSMRRIRNRRGYPKGGHRMLRSEQQESVWDIVARSKHGFVWQPRGQYRDKRGWRYISSVWGLKERMQAERERLAEERAEREYWERTVEDLMSDIRYMLDNPPSVETVHNCDRCLCKVSV